MTCERQTGYRIVGEVRGPEPLHRRQQQPDENCNDGNYQLADKREHHVRRDMEQTSKTQTRKHERTIHIIWIQQSQIVEQLISTPGVIKQSHKIRRPLPLLRGRPNYLFSFGQYRTERKKITETTQDRQTGQWCRSNMSPTTSDCLFWQRKTLALRNRSRNLNDWLCGHR